MPDTNQRLRRLWIDIQQGWNELQDALKTQRALGSRADKASMLEASARVRKAMKAHSEAINAYTQLFNSRVHPGRDMDVSRSRKGS